MTGRLDTSPFWSNTFTASNMFKATKIVALDVLSRLYIDTVERPVALPDIKQLAADQANDPKLRSFMDGIASTSLQLQLLQTPDGTVYCELSKRTIFMPDHLRDCSHVFIHVDAVQLPLYPKYEGPYPVLERKDKVYKVQCHLRGVWISIDHLKPAFFPRNARGPLLCCPLSPFPSSTKVN